ncbi:MAG TPA: hypothetical protein VM364_07840 [Vicinamibacterales bacterium]|nr:hypothetical protein [Vicinamibacterales bacterium]
MRHDVLREREESFDVDRFRLEFAVLQARERDLFAQLIALTRVRLLVDRLPVDERVVQERELALEIGDPPARRGAAVLRGVLCLPPHVEHDSAKELPSLGLRSQRVEHLQERVLELLLPDARAAAIAVVPAVTPAVASRPAARQRLVADGAAHEAAEREVWMDGVARLRGDRALRVLDALLHAREELLAHDRFPVAVATDAESRGLQPADVDRVRQHPVDL